MGALEGGGGSGERGRPVCSSERLNCNAGSGDVKASQSASFEELHSKRKSGVSGIEGENLEFMTSAVNLRRQERARNEGTTGPERCSNAARGSSSFSVTSDK